MVRLIIFDYYLEWELCRYKVNLKRADKVTPKHIQCFHNTGKTIKLTAGGSAQVWKLVTAPDGDIMSDWSKHFRNHYCLDEEIDNLKSGTGLTRAEYLEQLIFPDKSVALGPSIRSGDFSEILMADFIEYVLGEYWVPRFRYDQKFSRNESTKGSDVVGFKMLNNSPPYNSSPKDELLVCEVKASLSTGAPSGNILQDAVDASALDASALDASAPNILRKSLTLNAYKRRLWGNGDSKYAIVERFQDPVNNPYKEKISAAAVLNDSRYDEETLGTTIVSSHPHQNKLIMFVMTGENLMNLAHSLYERAANEA